MKIPEIVINNSTKDYIVSRGFFNSYVTNNGEFNIYIDGIIEYVFDRKTNNLKDSNVIEYRSFYVEDAKEKTNRKEASTFVFDNLVKLPNLSFFEEIKNNNEKINLDYQLVCLLAKSDSIEKSLQKNELYYRKESFVYCINTGLNQELKADLTFRQIKTELATIYNDN